MGELLEILAVIGDETMMFFVFCDDSMSFFHKYPTNILFYEDKVIFRDDSLCAPWATPYSDRLCNGNEDMMGRGSSA